MLRTYQAGSVDTGQGRRTGSGSLRAGEPCGFGVTEQSCHHEQKEVCEHLEKKIVVILFTEKGFYKNRRDV